MLLDRLEILERGKRAKAFKSFSPKDPIFEDHFPGFSVVPGTLLIELMAQAAAFLIAADAEFCGWPLLVRADSVKFRRFVRPAEAVVASVEVAPFEESCRSASARLFRGEERVAEARLLYRLKQTAESPEVRQELAATFHRLTRPSAAQE